jgi:hypothetical protein
MHFDTTRLRLQLDVLERAGELDDARAIALLRSEFALALNASYFRALSVDDIAVSVDARSIPQDGVGRYSVTIELVERLPQMSDEAAEELLRREFRHALNASHFRRIAQDDVRVTLLERERAGALSST